MLKLTVLQLIQMRVKREKGAFVKMKSWQCDTMRCDATMQMKPTLEPKEKERSLDAFTFGINI